MELLEFYYFKSRQSVFVNPNQICNIQEAEFGTYIFMSSGEKLHVSQDTFKVKTMIRRY